MATADQRDPLANLPAEQAVLGAVLSRPDLLDTISHTVRPESFSLEHHMLIWSAIEKAAASDREPGIFAVLEALTAMQAAGKAGGLEYLAILARDAPGGGALPGTTAVLGDYARRRHIRDAGTRIAQEAYSINEPEALAAEAYDTLDRAVEGAIHEPGGILGDLIPDLVDEIDRRHNAPDKLLGLSTGLRDLDRLISGLCPGTLNILAARPSLGKTALALQIALALGLRDTPVFFASLEMTAKALLYRLAGVQSGLPIHKIKTGELEPADWPLLADAFRDIGKIPIWVDDTSGMHIATLPSRVRRFRRRSSGRPGLIIVDYLQLMTGRGENRTQEIGSISRGLKGLAKSNDCAVLALAQLNRDIERRSDKRPMLADLRESGDIEADADTVMFLHSEGHFQTGHPYPDITQIMVRKNREGPLGEVNLIFDGPVNRFKPMHGPLPADYYGTAPGGYASARAAIP